ncbi:MAG: phosphoribosylaminoimidazolesuccinocarboxamide synthase [Candidatus Buchananbacteria bacterium]|nr:phosphoribosylaminoimidazolesuccinocarboxamide synthase [Candidatus Buchananbacteria bacterium]
MNQNFSKGLSQVDIPELGQPVRGKVRDSWIVEQAGLKLRIMVTTDRQSAFVRNICTIPGKGQISNLISAFWFEMTQDIIANHQLAVPHPNVLIAKQAAKVIPVEVVVRRYMATGVTPTSVYVNYIEKGRREIYGLQFPDGLRPNQEFPMGTILTPTTKAANGHDQELTCDEARVMVDQEFGERTWAKIDRAANLLFEKARMHCLAKGILLVDTKFEFGIDAEGNLMLIDEVLTPDGSRFWLQAAYEESFRNGTVPEYNKNVLVDYLRVKGFSGVGEIPVIAQGVIDKMLHAYAEPYQIITGNKLPILETNPDDIKRSVLEYLEYTYAYR